MCASGGRRKRGKRLQRSCCCTRSLAGRASNNTDSRIARECHADSGFGGQAAARAQRRAVDPQKRPAAVATPATAGVPRVHAHALLQLTSCSPIFVVHNVAPVCLAHYSQAATAAASSPRATAWMALQVCDVCSHCGHRSSSRCYLRMREAREWHRGGTPTSPCWRRPPAVGP